MVRELWGTGIHINPPPPLYRGCTFRDNFAENERFLYKDREHLERVSQDEVLSLTETFCESS